MSDFDQKMKDLLSDDDKAYIEEALEETGFYKEALDSLKGPGSGMHVLTFIGTLVFGGLLIFCIWKFFQADTTRDQIFFAASAILLNSAQIALKLWFNMRLNRRAILREIKRLHLAIARAS